MGRPKRCATRPKPYISYNPPSSLTTTTEEPIDYTQYIVIPESGAPCPTITSIPQTPEIAVITCCNGVIDLGRLADLVIGESCGPYKINISGPDAQYFTIRNFQLLLNDCYVLSHIREYNITISLDDPAGRFASSQVNYTLNITSCE
jgi:hypothetical protein